MYLHPGILEKSHRPLSVQLNQYIDVAFFTRIAPSNGPKDGGMQHSQSPQLPLMRAQGLENALKCRVHSCEEFSKMGTLCCSLAASWRENFIDHARFRVFLHSFQIT